MMGLGSAASAHRGRFPAAPARRGIESPGSKDKARPGYGWQGSRRITICGIGIMIMYRWMILLNRSYFHSISLIFPSMFPFGHSPEGFVSRAGGFDPPALSPHRILHRWRVQRRFLVDGRVIARQHTAQQQRARFTMNLCHLHCRGRGWLNGNALTGGHGVMLLRQNDHFEHIACHAVVTRAIGPQVVCYATLCEQNEIVKGPYP